MAAYSLKLSFCIQVPNVRTPIRNLVAQDLPYCRAHIIVSSGKDNNIRWQGITIGQKQLAISKAIDTTRVVIDLDLAIDDKLTTPDVDIITPATGKICAIDTSSIWPEIKFEASPTESV